MEHFGAAEIAVSFALFVTASAGAIVLFDAQRLRINGGLVWPLFVWCAPPLALPLYFHFRRIHMKRLREVALATGTTELPKTPLAVLGKDAGLIALGVIFVLVGAVFIPWSDEHWFWKVPALLALAGVVIVVQALRNVRARSF